MARTSAAGSEWDALRLRVLARDGYRCVYCNRDADTVDHVIPRSKGGTDTEDNCVAACRTCNSTKGDRPLARTNYVNTRWLERI